MDADTAYIFAINYDDHPTAATLTLAPNWYISQTLYGVSPAENKLNLAPNDGSLLLLRRHRT